MAQEGMRRSKLPPGTVIHVRDKETPIRTGTEEQITPEFIAAGLLKFQETLGDLARRTENHSNPVDEYNTASLSGSSVTAVVTLQPTYDFMPEKILAAIVVGPPFVTTFLSTINQIALGATGVASYNNNSVPVSVFVNGGTVSAIAVNGINTGMTSGFVQVPANGSITVTYTVAPTTFTTGSLPQQSPNPVTVILGDRQWPITMPPTGIVALGPMAVILGRNDPRQLVAATPGQYSLELMGFADARFAT